MNRFQLKKNIDPDCRFCGFFSGDVQARLVDTPWLSNESYAALVSIGSIVNGWSLISPKSHVLNLATEYQKKSFWNFADDVVRAVSHEYGSVTVFEHGSCSSQSLTSCGTVHAHLHVVPLAFSLVDASARYDGAVSWVKCLARDIELYSNGREYLFVSDEYRGSETAGFISILEKETSQFFRRVIADAIGEPDKFDYKNHDFLEKAEESAEVLSRYYQVKATKVAY
ncbi:hypothetical protein VRC24_23960 [Pseudomonas poae]|uniref:hypothetical protein n=1 Tax=Pseudomonas poae TaxID=200451 RepID=UPI0030D4B37E